MSRNLIFCSDGTGNTFDSHITNVTRLIRCIALDETAHQFIVYDQGVGTTEKRKSDVDAFLASLQCPAPVKVLPAPVPSTFRPIQIVNKARGLATGYGLEQNVRELYRELSSRYEGPDDQVFLFGFSRGAFTVRALAGLLYRCHLPPRNATDFDQRFDRAWKLYKRMREDETRTREFREKQRPCPIHFLGIWDTVKSYGGIVPWILPHLRHNPIVEHVRHALALHEHRAWFKPTTWGQLDNDKKHAMKRVKESDRHLYARQTIEEVWFAGCHSDIGGGDNEEITARIALRWMLGEAVNVKPALRLNACGIARLSARDEPPKCHDLWDRKWWFAEQVPRLEIDNSDDWPFRYGSIGSNGRRDPADKQQRGGKIFVHDTALSMHSLPQSMVKRSETKKLPH